jgi:hypothetical protein
MSSVIPDEFVVFFRNFRDCLLAGGLPKLWPLKGWFLTNPLLEQLPTNLSSQDLGQEGGNCISYLPLL